MGILRQEGVLGAVQLNPARSLVVLSKAQLSCVAPVLSIGGYGKWRFPGRPEASGALSFARLKGMVLKQLSSILLSLAWLNQRVIAFLYQQISLVEYPAPYLNASK